jgi:hypothetical protein
MLFFVTKLASFCAYLSEINVKISLYLVELFCLICLTPSCPALLSPH